MAHAFKQNDRVGQILAIFAIIFFVFIIFLSGITNLTTSKNSKKAFVKTIKEEPFRGTIYFADGKVGAISQKKYYLAIDGRFLKKDKLQEFAKILSLYIPVKQKKIIKLLNKNKRVILSKNISSILANNLKQLSHKLDNMGFYKTFRSNHKNIRIGLEISEEKIARIYPYKTLLQPALGFVKVSKNTGISGIENSYNDILSDTKEGLYRAKRDVLGNLIFNKKALFKERVDGSSLVLSVISSLQKNVDDILDQSKISLNASQIIAVIMNSKTGKIYTLASTNRFNPKSIKTKQDIHNMNIDAIQYLFEPGSVMKSIIFAGLIEENLINLYELVKGYNGRMKLGKKVITDEHKKDYFSAEEGIIYSSNIVLSQLAQRLSGYSYKNLLENFELNIKSGIDLDYERVGTMPSLNQLNDTLIKATTAYGYGINVNLIQLIKAYNVFNNNGVIVAPSLVKKIAFEDQKPFIVESKEKKVISSLSATKMLKILRKVVTRGTGKRANLKGIFIAGKTGTAHISKKGAYQNIYNSTFVGFANEIKGNKKFTIGVLVIDPKKNYFASLSAVPIFKKIVQVMVKEKIIAISQ